MINECQHSGDARLHTWPIAHDGQLLIPVSVHRDKVLGVSVQHQPPAEASGCQRDKEERHKDDMATKLCVSSDLPV